MNIEGIKKYLERGFSIERTDKGFCAAILPDSKLSEIDIPESIDGIEITAFELNKRAIYISRKVRTIRLPSTVKSLEIGDTEVFGAGNTEIEISPENPYFFSDGAAIYSKDGKTLIRFFAGIMLWYNVRPGTRKIADHAFCCIGRLNRVTLPSGLESIGEKAFYRCAHITRLEIPDSVRFIGKGAFVRMVNLRDIHLPHSLTQIGEELFSGCTALETLTIPANVRDIAPSAFLSYIHDFRSLKGVPELREITVDAKNPHYCAEKGILYSKDKTRLIYMPEHKWKKRLVIPKFVQAINASAFKNNYVIEEVILSPNTKVIGESAFYNCTELRRIVFGKSVETIGDLAFERCEKLEEVILSPNTKVIGEGAFYNCTELQRIVIGKGVEIIGDYAFVGCGKLSIKFESLPPKLGIDILSGIAELTVYNDVQPDKLGRLLYCESHKYLFPLTVLSRETEELLFKVNAVPGLPRPVEDINNEIVDYEESDLLPGCFINSGFDFERYDEGVRAIYKLVDRPCHDYYCLLGTAYLRLKYPVSLSDSAREFYRSSFTPKLLYIPEILRDFSIFSELFEIGAFTEENAIKIIDSEIIKADTELTARLLELKNKYLPPSSGLDYLKLE